MNQIQLQNRFYDALRFLTKTSVEELVDAQLDELYPKPVKKAPRPSKLEFELMTELYEEETDKDLKALIKKRLFVLRLHFGD